MSKKSGQQIVRMSSRTVDGAKTPMDVSCIVQNVMALTRFKNPWDLILDRLRLRKQSYQVTTKSGIRLNIRPGVGDRYTAFETFGSGVYEEAKKQLECGNTVIDVGANIGCFSLYAAQVVGPSGRVLALEPEKKTHEQLLKNIKINNTENIFPLYYAVCGSSRTIDLNVSGDQYLFSSMFTQVGDRSMVGEIQRVPCVTIPEIMETHAVDHVDLLKLDCEGAEHEIIAALTPDVTSRINHIAMEIHPVPGWDNRATVERLKSFGYNHSFHHTHLFSRTND